MKDVSTQYIIPACAGTKRGEKRARVDVKNNWCDPQLLGSACPPHFFLVQTKVKNLVHKPYPVNIYEQSNTWREPLAIDYKKVAFTGVSSHKFGFVVNLRPK